MGLIEDNRELILHQFLELYWSASRIARELGVSRQGVVSALNSWGYDTSKAARNTIYVQCSNPRCKFGVEDETGSVAARVFPLARSRVREKLATGTPWFCSRGCFNEYQRNLFD
jgi:hypothetical protein